MGAAAVQLAFVGAAAANPLEILASGSEDARAMLIAGMVLGIVFFTIVVALMFLRATRRARSAEARARSATVEYERKTDFLNAVLGAEPQILIHWTETGVPSLAADTLDPALDVPRDVEPLLKFGDWLDAESAQELSARVGALREDGEGFNLMLKTVAGAHVEADGRAAGGGSVLKIRDLAGRRAELASVSERHRRLSGDIERARGLLDALDIPVWFRTPSGALEWVNKAYARAVGAEDAERARAEQIELGGGEFHEQAKQQLDAGDTYRGDIRSLSEGETCSFSATALRLGEGDAGFALPGAGLMSEGIGLGDRLASDTHILDQIGTAVAIFSSDQRLRYSNEAFAKLWSLDQTWLTRQPLDGELLDRLRSDRHLPEQADYRDWKKGRLGIYADGEAREDWWHLPDGRAVHVVAHRAADGGVTYLYDNKTEALALESRYNALMHVQKETLDHLGEGVAVFGSDGRLKLFNPSFAAIWNLDAVDLEAEPHIDQIVTRCAVLTGTSEVWGELQSAVTSIDDEREVIEGQMERPDGVYLAYAGLPLPDGGTLLTYVDISDTKRMENALIERNEALEAADRLKSAFISHVSYELRTPLTNTIGFAELLLNPNTGPLNDKQREYLGDIQASSDTLKTIIDDILDMATIDAGNLELKIVPASAQEIVDGAILGVRERLTRSNISLDVSIAPDAKEFMADARRLTQVLYNLLSNAIGFSDPGARIALACGREGPLIQISVEDHGCGIPEDYQQAAFDRFESKPQGSRHRGAGLGLAIVKSVVELHGGSVELYSVPDEGTRVTVRLPADGPGTEVAAPAAQPLGSAAQAAAQ